MEVVSQSRHPVLLKVLYGRVRRTDEIVLDIQEGVRTLVIVDDRCGGTTLGMAGLPEAGV